MKGKKSMLYTLALTIFVLVLLSLAVLFVRHANSMESRNIELSSAQKIYDIDTSAQYIFAKALLQKTGIQFNFTNNSFTIKEDLSQDLAGLDGLMNKLKSGLEKDFTTVDVNLTQFLSKHEILLIPLNVTYELKASNKIRVPSHSQISGYSITLNFTRNITSCSINIEDVGGLTLNFFAESVAMTCSASQSSIDNAKINLTVNDKDVVIDLKGNGELNLESNATVESIITITIPELKEKRYLEIPISVEINDTATQSYKKSKVKLPLLP